MTRSKKLGHCICDPRKSCPCNLLIDGVVRALFPGQAFDREGALAGIIAPIRGEPRRVGERPEHEVVVHHRS